MASLYKKRAEESEGKSSSKYSLLNVSGIPEYKVKEGKGIKNKINILKYKVGGKNHPMVAKGELEAGDEDFMFSWFQHRVGPDGTNVVCLKRTYGKRCPCCEVRDQLIEQGLEWDDPKVKPYSASERSAFLVQDVSGDVAGEVQLFNVSAYLFTKKLMTAASEDDMAADFDDDFVEFAEPGKLGRVVVFRCKTEGQGKLKKTEFDGITFAARSQKFEVPASDMDLPSLDKYLKIHSYDEIKALMEGEDMEEEETPKPKKKPAVVEEEEEEEAPKPRKKAPPPEEEEEEAPKPKKAPAKDDEDPKIDFGDDKCASCPNGKKWGSADMFPCCQKCDPDTYDACCKAS